MNSRITTTSRHGMEVELVDKVKGCTDCQWFWGGIPPYGPFPAFDWDEPFPEAIRRGPDVDVARKPIYWTNVKQVQGPRVEPAVLRGCRKAPIMTVGINPNMTAFWAGPQGTSWAYPFFARAETYAYYYRHATVYQESFSLEELQRYIKEDTKIVAKQDCVLTLDVSNTYRWMSLEIEYDDGTVDRLERAWKPEERFVIFAPVSSKQTTLIRRDTSDTGVVVDRVLKSVTPGLLGAEASLGGAADDASGKLLVQYRIPKGALIAAKLELKAGDAMKLFANRVDYYTRLQPALDRFADHLHQQGYEHCRLDMGEDVSMHDMVACASPGWDAKRYGLPVDWIGPTCVDKNRYVIDQMIQSRPRLTMIVSNSTLGMFISGIRNAGGNIDLDPGERDTFELLRETATNVYSVTLPTDTATMTSRIIVTPHFSYADNFVQQSRLEKSLWEDFAQRYPDDVSTLDRHARVRRKKDGELDLSGKFVVIEVSSDDAIKTELSEGAWSALMQHHFDPYALITGVLIQEQGKSSFIGDPAAVHLDRAAGSCRFCVNDRWVFPEGCEYGVAK